jgi:flagellar protein FlaG
MPIDILSQIGATASKPPGPGVPAAQSLEQAARAEAARQALPAPGNVLPQGVVRANTPAADVQNAVQQLNAYVQNMRRDLRFSVDEDSGRSVVKVVDSETGETIRQFPAEEVLAVSRVLSEVMEDAKGFILSDSA